MALLTPNASFRMNGVTVNEKIIPDGTRWKDADKAKKAGFSAGSLYKKQQKLSGGTGKVKHITVHNTADLANVNDDGEQYTRATYNENMGSARVHYYIDDLGAWQNLKAGTGLCANDPNGSAEVGWHAGDGSVADGGNMTSISLEIIMNDTADHDAKAKDNGARIIAWLLWKHGLSVDKVVSHTYWENKTAGKSFADVDTQCTNPVYGKKWCPTYIFASSNAATAKKNWLAFKQTIQKYLDALTSSTESEKGDVLTDMTKEELTALVKQTVSAELSGLNGKIDERVSVKLSDVTAKIDTRISTALQGKDVEVRPSLKKKFAEAKERGITDGTRPGGYARRDEVAAMIVRATKL